MQSSQSDGQTGRDFFRHGINQNLPLQQAHLQHQHQTQHNLPLQQQSFGNANSNISIKQHAAVIQQQTNLVSPSIAVPTVASNSATPSALTAPPPPSQFVHWSNPLINGAPLLQTQSSQTAEVQQQQFNDFLFNIQAQAAYAAAATVPPSQVAAANATQETYSVLRVGNGNFLKIYHCPENAMGPIPGSETSYSPLQHYNQGPAANFHHVNPQAGAAVQTQIQPQQSQNHVSGTTNAASPQAFNSYELFSSNTFTQLPTAEMPPLLLLGPTAAPSVLTPTEDSSAEKATCMDPANMVQNVSNNNSNNNWACNQPAATAYFAQPKQSQIDILAQGLVGQEVPLSTNNNKLNATPDAQIIMQKFEQQHASPNQNKSAPHESIKQNITIPSSETAAVLKTEIPRQEAPKKRIVAEVKPMRMTYSDVLSKFNNQNQNSHQNPNNASLTSTSVSPTSQNLSSQRSTQKSMKIDSNNAINLRRVADDAPTTRGTSKKSPTHENKENQQQQQIQNNKLNNNQKRLPSTNNTNNTLNTNINVGATLNKSASNIQKNFNIGNKNNPSNNNNINENQSSKKQRINKNSDILNSGAKYYNTEQRGPSKTNGNNEANNSTSTSNANTYNSANNTYARKSTKASISNNLPSATGQQRSRYQNNLNASYSYSSTKRNRNNSSYATSSSLYNSTYGNGSRNNRNYEFAKRFLQAWYIYTLKILTWLFYLVYDTVVLGCSILYERLMFAYEHGQIHIQQIYKDLKQNSNKPGIWFKNYCRKFDARFSKTSKWAFWRKFYKKKQAETANESIKTGRLPATGEEAMFQLLNCKGKDAYSILGVPPNSSQEQIRKHYKKIAVLVHPDKNKQAGAEEAFKVLQRAFELIGEPENRLAYDHSLAEALHAEKAWTELHDLLSQLQTKITEAANTIRCSTCGLRHPRKITDRPHYAARECASCKIRHPAREGDIWAETSMLGLRWKYLALMEGKVYDITEWSNCQKGALAHLEPNSHMVQYRIVRGGQQQQQNQQNKQQAQHQQQQHNTGSQFPSTGGVGGKFKRDNIPPSEASLHEFLDNLYSGQHPQQQQNTSAYAGSSRRRNRRN